MKQDNSFIGLLDAMSNKASALLLMQIDVENGDFDYAMENHFEYLYWHDEFQRLYRQHEANYWELRWKVSPNKAMI